MTVSIFALLLLLVFAALTYLGIRNQRVLRFRLALVADISKAAQADIDKGNFDWRWRYDALDAVSYERMLLSLAPLEPEAFYEDTSFLRVAS